MLELRCPTHSLLRVEPEMESIIDAAIEHRTYDECNDVFDIVERDYDNNMIVLHTYMLDGDELIEVGE